jgi:hypothetical protein
VQLVQRDPVELQEPRAQLFTCCLRYSGRPSGSHSPGPDLSSLAGVRRRIGYTAKIQQRAVGAATSVGPVQAALQVFRPFRSFTGNADRE